MTEIEDLITRYNVDSRNTKLRDYYGADNLWHTLQIERDENRHSSFLAWLLNKDAINDNSPLYKFLNLIIRRKEGDEETDYKELKRAILLGNLKLKSVQIIPEKVISTLSKIRYNDRIDIYTDCIISGVGNYSRLEIFIENKIDSGEGDCKNTDIINPTPEEETYKGKKQTERYYYACSKDNNLRNDSFIKDNTLQIFIFLTAREQKPTDSHFVTVSYQDMVDFIIVPYLNREDIDDHMSMTLRDYLRILGNPFNNMTIMATTPEEKELLEEFYKRNEDLFRRALEVMHQNSESDEEAKNYKEILDSINKQKKVVRRFFRINGVGEYKMYEIVAEFTKHLIKAEQKTIADVEKIIKEYSNENNRCHVSIDKSKVFRSERCYEAKNGDEPFYVTKEWGMGRENYNFDGLQKNINKSYTDFQIQEI